MEQRIEKINGGITEVQGLKAAGICCGIKKDDKDLALLYSIAPASAAGVFTRNKFKAAPVIYSEEIAKDDNSVQAIIINSGNANACTGEKGIRDTREIAETTAKKLGLGSSQVLVASTGVVGVSLPMDSINRGLNEIVTKLSFEGGHEAAEAILTTDTVTKEVAYRSSIENYPFVIGGFAKGSGMIYPDMATMLAFLATNINIEDNLLRIALQDAVNRSFNLITVDGDTSTNDMVIIMANKLAGNPVIKSKGQAYSTFFDALCYATVDLAKMIVRDGEGATKLIEVKVQTAPDFETGKKLAMSVLNSNLVKTAFFGEDANWGRIVTAMGYTDVFFEPTKVDIYLGNLQVMAQGKGINFNEREAKNILQRDEIVVTIDLNLGKEEITAWGTDLSYEYININSSYRT